MLSLDAIIARPECTVPDFRANGRKANVTMFECRSRDRSRRRKSSDPVENDETY